ncbi:hypothetical protein GCM10010123_02800 [Pilimelia anulata]|uniref:Carboxypeptidase regulatory-like domain-containing protein n=1 Tax=Pilimelia anulata TaxID=53371 RepID=A0A8J3B2M1_9ACTN|nr:carboxypeptidase-like regulatory domain-containing protein [Pilimelia anulata]GGJ76272.1 hypothetical protein GCM10010123_02800 [Pilimelia anulata]
MIMGGVCALATAGGPAAAAAPRHPAPPAAVRAPAAPAPAAPGRPRGEDPSSAELHAADPAAAVDGLPRGDRTPHRIASGRGTVVAAAADEATGRAVKGICARILLPDPNDVRQRCTKGRKVTIEDIPTGLVTVAIWAKPYRYYVGMAVRAQVRDDRRTHVTTDLRVGGLITGAVVDRAGRGVRDATLEAFNTSGPRTYDTWADAGADGTASTPPLPAGEYRLFVTPPDGSTLGRQWVGADGGTGRESLAATITVTAGSTTTAPTARLDPGGAISGTISTPAGADVPAWVHLRTERAWDAADGVAADDQGRFTMTGLGPYDWALRFSGMGFAHQWAGGVADSAAATGVPVQSGQTATVALRAAQGIRISGAVSPTGPGENLRFVEVLDATGGARLGISNDDADVDAYEVFALGDRKAKLHWVMVVGNGPRTTDGWYDRAAEYADATAVPLPRTGRTTVDLHTFPDEPPPGA